MARSPISRSSHAAAPQSFSVFFKCSSVYSFSICLRFGWCLLFSLFGFVFLEHQSPHSINAASKRHASALSLPWLQSHPPPWLHQQCSATGNDPSHCAKGLLYNFLYELALGKTYGKLNRPKLETLRKTYENPRKLKNKRKTKENIL